VGRGVSERGGTHRFGRPVAEEGGGAAGFLVLKGLGVEGWGQESEKNDGKLDLTSKSERCFVA
jgi:hypothetical protein